MAESQLGIGTNGRGISFKTLRRLEKDSGDMKRLDELQM